MQALGRHSKKKKFLFIDVEYGKFCDKKEQAGKLGVRTQDKISPLLAFLNWGCKISNYRIGLQSSQWMQKIEGSGLGTIPSVRIFGYSFIEALFTHITN